MLMNGLDNGTSCPCCGQFAKVYKRKMRSDMAHWLIWLVLKCRDSEDGWADVRQATVRNGDYAKTAHWGLAVQKMNQDTSKKNSGLWRPTDLGVQFVECRLKVPSHVHLYDNSVVGWSDKMVTVVEALGEHFNYQELMNF
jgi:hypothetical protein